MPIQRRCGMTGFLGRRGSKFAAGPSTCSDEITSPHHRTVGEPGQGVDATLLCSAIKNCSPTRPGHVCAGIIEAAAKRLFLNGGGRMDLPNNDEQTRRLS